jgi:spore cortex protein
LNAQKVLLLTSMLSISFISAGCNNDHNNKSVGTNTQDGAQNVRYNVPNTNDMTNVNNKDNHMNVADQAVQKVTTLNEVKKASVIVTDNNAFAAVVLKDDKTLTNNLQEKISDAVRSTDSNIKNVYISANPDFVKHMEDYSNKLRNGKPIVGLFKEFSNMIQRVFPNAH